MPRPRQQGRVEGPDTRLMVGSEPSAIDLLVGEGDARPDLLSSNLLRPGVRAKWLVDARTRIERAGFDWTEVSPSALHERLQIARSLNPRVISLRLRPIGEGRGPVRTPASATAKLELEGALERTVERAVIDRLQSLEINGYVGLEVVHLLSGRGQARAMDPHVHVLLLELSKPLKAAEAAVLEEMGLSARRRVRNSAPQGDDPDPGR